MALKIALQAYIEYMRHRDQQNFFYIQEHPKLPCTGAKLLHVKPNAIVISERFEKYPVLIKSINHANRRSYTVEKLARLRQIEFLQVNQDGEYCVNKSDSLYLKCQSLCALYRAKKMVLVCYCYRTCDILPVDVKFDEEFFETYLCELVSYFENDYLDEKSAASPSSPEHANETINTHETKSDKME